MWLGVSEGATFLAEIISLVSQNPLKRSFQGLHRIKIL